MTDLAARVYEVSHLASPGVPEYVKGLLLHHQDQGHGDIRLFDYSDRGYLMETYRNSLGQTVAQRHEIQPAERTGAAGVGQ